MNTPNKLSISRACAIPAVVILMYIGGFGCTVAALIVFCAASFTDFLDGKIARKNGLVTSFGKFIDPVADKLLVLSTLIMFAAGNKLIAVAVAVVLARELAVDGLRMIAVGNGKVIAASKLGKIKTASQMGFIILLYGESLGLPLHTVNMVVLCWVVAITLLSGIDYFRKNGKCLMESK